MAISVLPFVAKSVVFPLNVIVYISYNFNHYYPLSYFLYGTVAICDLRKVRVILTLRLKNYQKLLSSLDKMIFCTQNI